MSTREKNQPILSEKDYALAFEGQLFPPSKTSNIQEVAHRLKPDFMKNAKHIIREFDGSYAFVIAAPNKALAGRDSLGTCPLFYGENQRFSAVASERKPLWTLGITNAKAFPLGNLALMNAEGFDFNPVATLRQPPPKAMSMDKATSLLQSLLLKSTAERVSDVEEVAVAFSGGLDSTILTVLAKKCVSRVKLVSVGLAGQPELGLAQRAAESLELPFHLQTYRVADVEEVLERVLWLIEEPNVMKVGVAIPLFWAAETASRIGCHVLLAGQGADELFGGYHRYIKEYGRGGVKALQESLFHDLVLSYETNFQRDEPVCAFHKVELRLPYIDSEVVHLALSLPVNLKITSQNDSLRKRVLRQVAKNLGIPELVVERSKKAVQYATGVDKALEQLAQRKGLTKHVFIKQVFGKIFPSAKGEQS